MTKPQITIWETASGYTIRAQSKWKIVAIDILPEVTVGEAMTKLLAHFPASWRELADG